MYLLFFFNDTATTEIYTLSLHDALPIYIILYEEYNRFVSNHVDNGIKGLTLRNLVFYCVMFKEHLFKIYFSKCKRSEEHTSELQSRQYIVCRLLLETKKKRSIRLTDNDG